jgi:hypothetical protein
LYWLFRKKLKCSVESIGREEIIALVRLEITSLGKIVIRIPTTILLPSVPVIVTASEKQAVINNEEINLLSTDIIQAVNSNDDPVPSIRPATKDKTELPTTMIPSHAAIEANRLVKMVSLLYGREW